MNFNGSSSDKQWQWHGWPTGLYRRYPADMDELRNALNQQHERTMWSDTKSAYQKRLTQPRNQRDRRPRYERRLQRGRNSSHLDQGNS